VGRQGLEPCTLGLKGHICRIPTYTAESRSLPFLLVLSSRARRVEDKTARRETGRERLLGQVLGRLLGPTASATAVCPSDQVPCSTWAR